MGLATLNREYPQQTPARRQAFALYVSVAICSVGIAPVLGALLADYASWRWAFLVVPPAAVVVGIGILRVVPAVPEGAAAQRSFDAPGALLLFVAVGLFLFAIQQGSRYGWWTAAQGISFLGKPWHLATSPTPILFAVSALLIAAFLLLERWRAHRQLDVVIDFRLFHISSYVWGTLAVALSSSASIGVLLMVSLYAEYVINAGPLVAGLIVMPLGFAVLVTGALGERLTRFPGRSGDTRRGDLHHAPAGTEPAARLAPPARNAGAGGALALAGHVITAIDPKKAYCAARAAFLNERCPILLNRTDSIGIDPAEDAYLQALTIQFLTRTSSS